jgi:hypothetical protein
LVPLAVRWTASPPSLLLVMSNPKSMYSPGLMCLTPVEPPASSIEMDLPITMRSATMSLPEPGVMSSTAFSVMAPL